MYEKIKNKSWIFGMLLMWAVLSAFTVLGFRLDVKSKSSWKEPDRISVIKQDETIGRDANIYILHDNHTGTDVLYIDNWFYSDSSAVRLSEGDQ